MDPWKYYDITHRYHRICNPISVERLDEVCDLLGLKPRARVLDVACGKAELLVRLAERYRVGGVGIDLSPYAIRDARDRAERRVPGADLEFVGCDGADYDPGEAGAFDLAMCIGASWIWDGYRGTLLRLAEMTRPGGLILIGETFWTKEPPREYLEAEGMRRDDFMTHHGNVRAGEDEGLTFLYSAVSSHDDWDRYEGLQWYAAAEYAREYPDDPDLPALTERVRRSRDAYLRWGRDCLGWALYLFRKP